MPKTPSAIGRGITAITCNILATAADLDLAEELLLDAVTAVMVSIGEAAEAVLEKAKEEAQGHAKVAITHALGQISRMR